MAVTSDEELMLAYQEGSSAAFDELYARYSGRVYSYLEKRVFNSNERDDLFQAVFLKLHKSRHLYLAEYPFAPWLFTICRTTLLDFLKARKPEVSVDGSQTEKLIGSDASEPSSLVATIENLPEKQRAALELRYKDGLAFSEIADRLKLSNSNVRQIISRAVRKLRGTR